MAITPTPLTDRQAAQEHSHATTSGRGGAAGMELLNTLFNEFPEGRALQKSGRLSKDQLLDFFARGTRCFDDPSFKAQLRAGFNKGHRVEELVNGAQHAVGTLLWGGPAGVAPWQAKVGIASCWWCSSPAACRDGATGTSPRPVAGGQACGHGSDTMAADRASWPCPPPNLCNPSTRSSSLWACRATLG